MWKQRRVDMEQNTQEWLEMRKTKIGASDAPIIMEESPYGTPFELYKEKLGLQERRQHAGMALGHEREPIARRRFEEEMLCAVEPLVVFHPTNDWMMASLDGYDPISNIAVEIKNTNEKDHESARHGKVPKKYYAQLQHQLEILFALNGLKSIHYFSYRNGDTVNLIVDRDEQYIEKMLEKERDFFNMLIKKEPPEDRRMVHAIEGDRMSQASSELAIIITEQERLKKREDELRKIIIDEAKEDCYQGYGLQIKRSTRRGCVDYTKVPQLKGVNLEPYRGEDKVIYTIRKIKNADSAGDI